MKCNQCHNEDARFFMKDYGVYYCRKCVSFHRMNVGQKLVPCTVSRKVFHVTPHLEYELTENQKKISNQICQYLKEGRDVFVYAATGAGKTECTFESICYYLSKGKKVCFAISRRQVVLEITKRLQSAFPSLHIICVTQGYTQITDGDIIVCTMHQLHRYPFGFDLLIMDEVDAFPFVDNDVLHTMADNACVGQKLYLSATPDEKSRARIQNHEMEMVCLFERPHKHPLIIPKVIQAGLFFQIVILLIFCVYEALHSKQVLVFVPRKQDVKWISILINFFTSCKGIHSESVNKDEIIQEFRDKKMSVLVCTTLLERGITIPSVQVVVVNAQHTVFTTASLIQIFGRVGRSFQDPYGKGLCLCLHTNKSIQDCISQLKLMNDSVYSV